MNQTGQSSFSGRIKIKEIIDHLHGLPQLAELHILVCCGDSKGTVAHIGADGLESRSSQQGIARIGMAQIVGPYPAGDARPFSCLMPGLADVRHGLAVPMDDIGHPRLFIRLLPGPEPGQQAVPDGHVPAFLSAAFFRIGHAADSIL